MSPTRGTFAEAADRYRGEILGYLTRLLGSPDDAEDVCQDVFLRAQRAFHRLGADANTRAWLYRIATNTARTAGRRRTRSATRDVRVDPDSLSGRMLGSPVHRVELRAVARAVEALPPRQRAALVLRRFQGLAYAEVAAAVGGSEAGARANVYQAIRRLRVALGGV